MQHSPPASSSSSQDFRGSRWQVDTDIARARTLPPEAFLDESVQRAELRTVFRESWLLADPVSGGQLDGPGAYAPTETAGSPVYFHRDLAGTLRAFPNVCTHAWYPVVVEPGRGKTTTCAQHGRRFDQQGRCVGQPFFGKVCDFPAKMDHLEPLPLQQLGPLNFLSLGPSRYSPEEVFGPIRASLEKMPLDQLELVENAEEVRVIEGNWKQQAWNYMDKFHIPFIHRAPGGLVDLMEYRDYRTELYPHAALQWSWAKHSEQGFDPDWLPERFNDPDGKGRRVIALWWFVFPNLTLNFYPWGLSINRYDPVPGSPDRCRFHWHHYVLDEEKYALRESVYLNRKTDQEDVEAMALAKRGLQSGFAERGAFAPGEEDGPHWFHRLVWEHLAGEFG